MRYSRVRTAFCFEPETIETTMSTRVNILLLRTSIDEAPDAVRSTVHAEIDGKKWGFQKDFTITEYLKLELDEPEAGPAIERVWADASDWLSRAVMHLNNETRPPEIPIPRGCPLVAGCLNCGKGIGYAGSHFCNTSCESEFKGESAA